MKAYLIGPDELYITQVNGTFHCTKFPFEEKFTLVRKSAIHKENGTEFQKWQVWKIRETYLQPFVTVLAY